MTVTLDLRFTEQQKAFLKQQAQAFGVTAEEYVKVCLMGIYSASLIRKLLKEKEEAK